MALALYRKYRPATFAEVVGQEHVTGPLRTALAAGRINHAYLFSGPRGCGKTSSARILARSLNCAEGPTPDPCGTCGSCVALAPEGPGSLDVVELDAASHGRVDDTRELRDRAFYMPAESRYRVFIIDEAHMVSKEGFNSLLKIVEEPPEHLVFVFATTEPDKVLTTIRSRTHHYPFRLLPPATLRGLLEKLCGEEGVTIEPTVYPLVVKAGAGSARDALSVMDQLLAGAGPGGVTYADAVALLGVTDGALLDEMVDALAASDGANVFGAIERVIDAGHDPRRFAADLLQRLRDLVILRAVPDAAEQGLIDEPEDQLATMTAQSDRLPTATLTRFADLLHGGLGDMRGTTSPRMVLELTCARMLLPAASLDDASLLQRLEMVERRLEIAAGHAGALPAAAGGEVTPARARPVEVSSAGAAAAEVSSVGVPATAGPAAGGAAAGVAAAPAARLPARAAEQAAPTEARAGQQSSPPKPAQPEHAGADVARDTPAIPDRPQPSAEQRERPEGRARQGQQAGPDLGLPPPPVLSTDRPDVDASPASEAEAVDSTVVAAESDTAPVVKPAVVSQPDADPERVGDPEPDANPEPDADPEPVSGPAAGSDRDSAPPPAAARGNQIDVTDVRHLWPEVLDAVKKRSRSAQALLESAAATAVRLDGGILYLSTTFPALARLISDANNTETIRGALHDVFGVQWRLRCDVHDASGPAGAGDAPPSPAGSQRDPRDDPDQRSAPARGKLASTAESASPPGADRAADPADGARVRDPDTRDADAGDFTTSGARTSHAHTTDARTHGSGVDAKVRHAADGRFGAGRDSGSAAGIGSDTDVDFQADAHTGGGTSSVIGILTDKLGARPIDGAP